jgi:peptidoglycan/xylan/chitin deacetylase (PgdA/CDA1 family)
MAAPGVAQADPPPPPTVEGPWPPEKVLAVDPSTVSPPDVATTFASSCPAAPYGVQHYAPGSGRTVALTFDDGPGASTQAIMNILEDRGVPATFFNIGVNATVRPSTVVAESDQRFPLGNHTWAHPQLTRLSATAQAKEMDDATAEQVYLVGSQPCLFRPPYGSYDSSTLSLAQARGMAVYNWSVDTEDWKANGSSDPYWVHRIISLGEAGGSQDHPLVLMHNQPTAMPATVSALPWLITYYRDRGYTFVDLTGHLAVTPISGDWDGNGTVTPGVVVGNTWYLRNSNSAGPADIVFTYGRSSDRPVTGDWDGNGTTTPGVVRGNTWYERNSNSSGPGTTVFTYGHSTDRVVTGDWDGNGTTTPGVVRGNTWYERNSNSSGPGTTVFPYGRASDSDRVVTGDWDGNGTTTPGIVRGNTWYLRNCNCRGPGNVVLTYGRSTDRVLTGDWDGNGTTTPGVVRGNTWYERNVNTSGAGTTVFDYAPSSPNPVVAGQRHRR